MKQTSGNIRGSLIGQFELLRIIVHTAEFNLSHMPNPLDTTIVKCKLCECLIRCVPM